MYRVLWIDDEYEAMDAFIEKCKVMHNIEIVGFTTRKSGMDALKDAPNDWDAILLDARGKDESENEKVSLKGLRNAIDEINQLKSKRDIPYYIYTGQPDLASDNKQFEESFGTFYVKSTDDEKLINQMLKDMSELPLRQIVNRYKDVFEAIDYLGMNEQSKENLIGILKPLHFDQSKFDPKVHYNQIRQIIEQLFIALINWNIMPDVLKNNGEVNLNQCSLYLAGKPCNAYHIQDGEGGIIPQNIENFIRQILDLCNDHSHSDENSDKYCYRLEHKSIYIIMGLAQLICELIVWFSGLVKEAKRDGIDYLSRCVYYGRREDYIGG
ncbi:MAG: hypothetical protein KBT32_01695 [Bacteroidales bacterium]|nr:hypothetical protein [Candidatus Physcocola equi]